VSITDLILKFTPALLGGIIVAGAWWSLDMYRRGDLAWAKGWLFAVLALAAPWFMVVVLGSTDSHMKSPEFCASCHIMQPFHDDLHELKSDGLAAKHFQNNWVPKGACYSCHSDYGAFGTVKAKMAGMRHVWAFYVKGQKSDPKLIGTYNNQNCLQCHGGDNRRYKAEPAHVDNAAEIEANETSCIECHNPMHNTDGPQAFLEKGDRKGAGHAASVTRR